VAVAAAAAAAAAVLVVVALASLVVDYTKSLDYMYLSWCYDDIK
jgi:hypothetical protein